MKFWFKKGVWTSKHARRVIATLSSENVRKVAVIRHAALGDMVLTRCVLVELRKAFPNAFITLSVISHYQRGAPVDLVDRVHVIHGKNEVGISFFEKIRRMKELGNQDLIFDFAATPRSMMTCFLNKATLKIGFPYRTIHKRLIYDIATHRSDLNFEVSEMLNTLHALGLKTQYPHDYAYPVPGSSRPVKPYVVYFSGASTPQRCWPENHFSELINKMATQYSNYNHMILKGLQEWESGAGIIEPIKHHPNVSITGTDNIEGTIDLLHNSSMVVSNDTGIRHLAIVTNTPTVCIFIYTEAFRYWPRYGGHEAVLTPDGSVPPVKDVFEACKNILDSD